MEYMQFAMTTDWRNHWDKLPDDRAYFSRSLIKTAVDLEAVQGTVDTLFIKQDGNNHFEKSWIGKTSDFKDEGDKVSFLVSDLVEYNLPTRFDEEPFGWYEVKGEAFIKPQPIFEPPFFEIMKKCKGEDHQTFERYCFYLFKLLGIHNVDKIINQNGHADGFIEHEQLFAFYDATLAENDDKKKLQLENYVEQLSKDRVEYDNRVYKIKNRIKQVWIITMGPQVRTVRIIDNIEVLEIPVDYFIRLFRERLFRNMDSIEFFRRLANPGLFPL